MAPLNWCERCGNHFTPTGKAVNKAATARGPVFDIPTSVCPRCLRPDERLWNGEVVTVNEYNERNERLTDGRTY